MKKLVLLSIIIMLFTTCKKTMYKSWVEGQVLDQHTHQPIENVTVFLVGSNAGSSGTPSFNEIESVTTGSDGKFSFSFNRSEYDHYFLYAKPQEAYKYFAYNSSADYIELSFGRKFRKETVTKDIELLHCGYLKVNFNHISSDTILYIGVGYDKGTLYTDYGGTFQSYIPSYIDNTTHLFCLQGNTTNKINIITTKKGAFGAEMIDTTINLSYYTIPHETIDYQLNY